MSDAPNNSEAGSAGEDFRFVVALCRFESAWKAGERPRIEDFLAHRSAPEQAALFPRLLALEITMRRAAGETPTAEDWAGRFPDHVAIIREALDRSTETGPSRNGDAEPPAKTASEADHPAVFGRYRVMGQVGAGGFGTVYSAFDDELRRMVAVKVPHARWSHRSDFSDQYLAEARTLARLDHPNIVPVFDFGRTPDGRPFVVSKFIEGNNLSEVLNQGRPTFAVTRSIVASVAEALHSAHLEGIVHRDVKPGNILIESSGKAFLADFGMVLREEEFGTGPSFAGTPAYMSPEQARSEGHRVDGRSDVFSLGIVFYQMLTGRRPFAGDSEDQLLANLIEVEPRPPRQIDDGIPRDLERICLKALAKRAADRYTTAKDMAEDLRLWIGGDGPVAAPVAAVPMERIAPPTPAPTQAISATSDREPIRIVPKGLRSFDANDSDFFLELLPGPRDRDGLPNSIRFWKSRIEETNPDATFSLGLIYGPSGCGKSSLIKAGLLPRLSADVIPVYIEATADDTEARLLNGLRRRFADLRRDDWSLVESMAALRKGCALTRGKKALIVIDQFEQWLHAHVAGEGGGLVSALRQCDAGRLQCIVTVRDDFWLAVSRFLRDLEIRLVEGQNSALADLFDRDHARRVLAAFGRAFGRLPDRAADTSKDAKEFLRLAVEGLAQEHKVNCVRLALFAEMMKDKDWTPAALKAVGGTAGVGVTFLEETFSAATAPPAHRVHQVAARTVLSALLPEAGSDIRGAMRSHDELLGASKYPDPRDFDELLRILDGELRLITPTDPQGIATTDPSTGDHTPGRKHYQLTHDYLVPSLRDWLTRKQKESRRGRAALALADRAAVWNSRPENRQLPSLWQWLSFRRLTDKTTWTEPQRKMMRRARRVQVTRLGIGSAVLLIAGLIGWESYGRARAHDLRDDLLKYPTAQAPETIRKAARIRRWFNPLLQETLEHESDPDRRLRASLGLLPADPNQAPFVFEQWLKCDVHDFPAILEIVSAHRTEWAPALWQVLENSKNPDAARLRAACALAEWDADSGRWEPLKAYVAGVLVNQDFTAAGAWAVALKQVNGKLLEPLLDVMQDEGRTEAERTTATVIFGNYARDHPGHWETVATRLAIDPDPKASKEKRERAALRRANLGVAMLQLQEPVRALPVLMLREDPTARSHLIHKVNATRVRVQTLLNRLQDDQVPALARQALILESGEFALEHLGASDRDEFVRLMERFCRDPDGGVRGAAEWLLRRWGLQAKVDAIDAQLMEQDKETARTGVPPPGGRKWFVNSQKRLMVIVEPGRLPTGNGERRRDVELTRRFAMGAHEITAELFQIFAEETGIAWKASTPADHPALGVTWYQAAAFCNWLTRRDRMNPDQCCYVLNALGEIGAGMSIRENVRDLLGYRLPDDLEWEFAYRAGSKTPYFFGESEDLAAFFAWSNPLSKGTTQPVGRLKPNFTGLFDMDGGAAEWCQNLDAGRVINDLTHVRLRPSSYLRGIDALGAASVTDALPTGVMLGVEPTFSYLSNCGFRVVRTLPK